MCLTTLIAFLASVKGGSCVNWRWVMRQSGVGDASVEGGVSPSTRHSSSCLDGHGRHLLASVGRERESAKVLVQRTVSFVRSGGVQSAKLLEQGDGLGFAGRNSRFMSQSNARCVSWGWRQPAFGVSWRWGSERFSARNPPCVSWGWEAGEWVIQHRNVELQR